MIEVLLYDKNGAKLFSSVINSTNKKVLSIKNDKLGITGEFFLDSFIEESTVKYLFDSLVKIAALIDAKCLNSPSNELYFFALKNLTKNLDYNMFKKLAEENEKKKIEKKLDKNFLIFK